MRVAYVVNNYALDYKVKTTPVDKIVKQERVGQKRTFIVYELSNQKEKEFCDKVLAKNGQVID